MPATHGKAALDLVLQGKADLAGAADVPFVLAVMQGESIGNAASMLSNSNDIAIVARRDRGIAAPHDLTGKKIGVSFGAGGEYFLWAFMIRNKLAPESATLVNLAPDQIAKALVDGDIDAMATWQPVVYKAQTALGEHGVTFIEHQAYTLNFLLIGQQAYLKANPRVIEKFVRVMLKAENFNRSQPEDALSLVARRMNVEVSALRPSWKNFEFKVDLQQSQLITLEDQARWAMARGLNDRTSVPNFLRNLYFDALLAVKPERVTVIR